MPPSRRKWESRPWHCRGVNRRLSLLPFTRWPLTAPPDFLTDALGDPADLTAKSQLLRAMAIALIIRGMFREAVAVASRAPTTALVHRFHLETGRTS